MITGLIEYQEWYRSLDRSAQSAYVSALGGNAFPEKEKQLRSLAREFLHKEVSGCGFCIQSAHFEIIRLDIDKMKKITTEYQLLPGAVLHDPVNKDFNKILTARNITEELTLYHIANNRGAVKYFSKLPSDLAERLQKYIEEQGKSISAEDKATNENKLALLDRQVEIAKAEMDGALKVYEAAKDKYDEFKKSADGLRAIVEGKPIDVEEPHDAAKADEDSSKKPSDADNIPASGLPVENPNETGDAKADEGAKQPEPVKAKATKKGGSK